MSQPCISEKSAAIHDKFKKDVFKSLFRELDTDCDNLITADAINITTLPLQTVRILAPLFEELDQIEEGID